MEVSEFCGSSFCYLQDTSSCSSMVKYDWNAAVSRNRCGHLVRTAKDCHGFIEEFATKRATHAATTRQQLFSMIQQSPTNKVPIRSLLQKKQTSNPLARVSMLANKIFLEKTSAMQPHRPGDHGQPPFVPGAPLAPPAAPWGGRAGSPAMKLGRSENDTDRYSPSDRFTWQDSTGRPIRFLTFQVFASSRFQSGITIYAVPAPTRLCRCCLDASIQQDYAYFAGKLLIIARMSRHVWNIEKYWNYTPHTHTFGWDLGQLIWLNCSDITPIWFF